MLISHSYLLIIVSLFFLSSCVSAVKSNIEKAKEEDDISKIALKIKTNCFQVESPSFFVSIDPSRRSLSSFQMEGVWKENFKLLQMRVVGLLGEDYASFSLNENTLENVSVQSPPAAQKNIDEFIQLFSTIGSKGMRNFLCGHYAFEKNTKSDGVYYEPKNLLNENDVKIKPPQIITENSIFNSISTIELKNHNVEVKSDISFTKKNNVDLMNIQSHFYYGPFSKESDIIVKWSGIVNKPEIIPTHLSFIFNDQVFSVRFNDFQ